MNRSRFNGHPGMEQAIAGLQARVPGAVLTRTGEIQVVQDLVTYTWALGPVGGAPIASGRDVLFLREGKISSLYVHRRPQYLIDGRLGGTADPDYLGSRLNARVFVAEHGISCIERAIGRDRIRLGVVASHAHPV